MRVASKSAEGEMVEDFLRNVHCNHGSYGIAMLMALHRQHVLVESNESALVLLNEVMGPDSYLLRSHSFLACQGPNIMLSL
jgi:hypothetical protein